MTSKKIRAVVLTANLTAASPSWAIFGIGDIVIDPAVLAETVLMYGKEVESALNTYNQWQQAILSYERWLINATGIPKAFRVWRTTESIFSRGRSLIDGNGFFDRLIGDAWSTLYGYGYDPSLADLDEVYTKYSRVTDPQTAVQMTKYYEPYLLWQQDQQKVLEQYGDNLKRHDDYMSAAQDLSFQVRDFDDKEADGHNLAASASANILTAQGIGQANGHLNRIYWELNKRARMEEAVRQQALRRNFDDAEALRATQVGYVDPRLMNIY
jgi:hypothetical protein